MKTYVYMFDPSLDYGMIVIVIVAKNKEDAEMALRANEIFQQKVACPSASEWSIDDSIRQCQVMDGPGVVVHSYEA